MNPHQLVPFLLKISLHIRLPKKAFSCRQAAGHPGLFVLFRIKSVAFRRASCYT